MTYVATRLPRLPLRARARTASAPAYFTIERLTAPDAVVVTFADVLTIDVFLAAVRAVYTHPAHRTLDSIWDYSHLDDRAVLDPEDVTRARALLPQMRPDGRHGRTVFVVAGPNLEFMIELYRYLQRDSPRRYDLVHRRDDALALLQAP